MIHRAGKQLKAGASMSDPTAYLTQCGLMCAWIDTATKGEPSDCPQCDKALGEWFSVRQARAAALDRLEPVEAPIQGTLFAPEPDRVKGRRELPGQQALPAEWLTPWTDPK